MKLLHYVHPKMENTHLIFFSYARPDQERVLPFFDWLEKRGFNVWMDCRRIKAGQNWDVEIKRALDRATFVLVFISKLSVDKRGYVQRELKLALDKLDEKLIDDIYIIPVLLDEDAQVPEQLRGIQNIRASNSHCNEQIADSLEHQLERLGLERRELQEKEQIYWTSHVKREEWDGLPGYDVELEFLEFHSDLYPNISEIGEHIKGSLLPDLFEHREIKLTPRPDLFNYGQGKYYRTSTYHAYCGEPFIVGKVISIKYEIDWYGAGAAHGNYHCQTYLYLLEPLSLIRSLEDIFREPDSALETVQAIVREQLRKFLLTDVSDDETVKFVSEWIDEGTKDWDNFSAFILRPEGVEIIFAPYKVAAYASGPQSTLIPYERIAKVMRNEFVGMLEIQRLTL
jgi:hypothetical protein